MDLRNNIRQSGCILALVALLTGLPAYAESTAEVAVKAAVVHKISKFVTWPGSAFESGDSPIRFCVVGHDRMYDALLKLADRRIQGRTVDVRLIPTSADVADTCNVLYIGEDADIGALGFLTSLQDHHVLTFGESGSSGATESIVRLAIRRDKVRFAIDTQASDRAGLTISAQLLQLAATLGNSGV